MTTYAEPQRHTYLHPALDAHHRDGVARMVGLLGLRGGDEVLELGAGSGRFTDALLENGLRVLAIEPDPVLLNELRERLQGRDTVEYFEGTVDSVDAARLRRVHAFVGFHVLHHLDAASLQGLAERIKAQQDRNSFRGFAFLEPNPWSPLFPVQIAFTPGMRFGEEKGLWLNDYPRAFASCGVAAHTLGHAGLVPPPLARLLPASLLPPMRLGTRATQPFFLYRLVGHVRSDAA